MSFSEEYLQQAHKQSLSNREVLNTSKAAVCFDCCEFFPADAVVTWFSSSKGADDTASCPNCGNDSVLGDASGLPISNFEFVSRMNSIWCKADDA